jgi:hypothetical protein
VNQVRHEYPGFYDNWPNDKLERMVLEKYPEFADRVCVLSVRFDAPASDVIKYQLKPRTLLGTRSCGCARCFWRLSSRRSA